MSPLSDGRKSAVDETAARHSVAHSSLGATAPRDVLRTRPDALLAGGRGEDLRRFERIITAIVDLLGEIAKERPVGAGLT